MSSEEEDSGASYSDGDHSGGEIVDSKLPADYEILKEADITQRQNDDISTVSNFLSVSRGTACSLLRYYNWIIDDVYDHWFTDENKVREAVGLLQLPKKQSTKQSKKINGNSLPSSCGICFDDFSNDNPKKLISDSCAAHPFCFDCLKSYLHVSINDGGSGCLTLRCPEPKCNAIVDLDLVDSLASDVDKEKYHKYLQRSYVEDSRKRKWCSGPGCDYVIEYDCNGEGGCGSYDVTCKCLNKFCWNCNEESHRPVDCEMVKEWNKKNDVEGVNTLWILKNTKPCPKCKKPIEKNQGCNNMTCRSPCGFRFCWVCLAPIQNHVKCNKYVESRGELAKQLLEKYAHYYERWAYNNSSRKKAMVDLNRAKSEHIDKLLDLYKVSRSQLNIVSEAWEQIVECRRVLKWSYAYGFYLPKRKKNFFEFLQGEAEVALERLHYCLEQEMEQYTMYRHVAPPEKVENFIAFRIKLVDYTKVAKNFFKNLVRALENDLSEVESFID